MMTGDSLESLTLSAEWQRIDITADSDSESVHIINL